MNDINDLLNNNTESNEKKDHIGGLADRFKSITFILYILNVSIIILATIVGLVMAAESYLGGGAVFFILVFGVISLIFNELVFGSIATVIKIRDNTENS